MGVYPGAVLRRSLSILLTLACAVHEPSLAWAGPPEDVDVRAEGLFNEGKYLEAAELQVAALKALPESLANRPQRNLWATGAVNAYLQVFTADPTQCTAATAGLAVADDYLKALLGEYGASVASADEYTGMQRLHGELDEARARNVRDALYEDIGRADWTSLLVPAGRRVQARVVVREAAVLCGRDWFDACIHALDPAARITWHHAEGAAMGADTPVCEIEAVSFPA